jgi:hypothetical protein
VYVEIVYAEMCWFKYSLKYMKGEVLRNQTGNGDLMVQRKKQWSGDQGVGIG